MTDARFPDALIHRRPRPGPQDDRECSVCGRRYDKHSSERCAICKTPLEHHDLDVLRQEITRRARMARARQAAGVPLDDVDRAALEADW